MTHHIQNIRAENSQSAPNLDDFAHLLERAERSPLGRIFQRWMALQGELETLSLKRTRAIGELGDKLMASMIAEQETACREEAVKLTHQAQAMKAASLDDTLFKLVMWRMYLAPLPGQAPPHTALAISALEDLNRFAKYRPDAAARDRTSE